MSLNSIEKPNGGVARQRVMGSAPSDENLMEQIFAGPNVRDAWKRVKANKGAAGVTALKSPTSRRNSGPNGRRSNTR